MLRSIILTTAALLDDERQVSAAVGPMHVLFLAGQSNAEANQGTVTPPGFPDSTIPMIARLGPPPSFGTYTSGNTPVDLGATNGFHSLDLQCAKNLQAAGRRVAVVKFAINSTHIADWQKGNPDNYFATLVTLATLARTTWGNDAVIHFVWLQSESDAIDSAGSTYEGYLRQFVADTRTDVGWLDFWQCKLQPSQVTLYPDGPTIIAAQATVMAEHTDTFLVNFDAINGALHYTDVSPTFQLATMGAQVARHILNGFIEVDFSGTSAATSSAAGDFIAQRAFVGTAAATSSTAGDLSIAGSGTPVDFDGTAAVTSSTAGNCAQYTALDPLSIVTSVSWLVYVVSDRGVTQSGGVVSQWDDQSGNGKHATSSGTKQPAFTANELGGHPAIIGDGVNDMMNFAGLDLPAPGTTNLWMFSIFNQKSWTINRTIYAGGASTCLRMLTPTTPPTIRSNNGASCAANTGAAVGAYTRARDFYKNTTGDYLRLGATSSTTINKLNTDAASGAFCLMAQDSAGTAPSNTAFTVFGITAGEPTAGEQTALDTWATNFYGSGNVAI